jgi:hypothetical protein
MEKVAATDIAVAQGLGLRFVIEEGVIQTILQDGTHGADGPRLDQNGALTGRL